MLHRLGKILENAIRGSGAQLGNIQLLEADGSLKIILQRGFSDSLLSFWEKIHFGEKSCQEIFRQSSRILVSDMRKCQNFIQSEEKKNQLEFTMKGKVQGMLQTNSTKNIIELEPTYSFVIDELGRDSLLSENVFAFHTTPIYSRKGNMLGLMSIHYQKPILFKPSHFLFINTLVMHAADIIDFHKDSMQLKREMNAHNSYKRYLENKAMKPAHGPMHRPPHWYPENRFDSEPFPARSRILEF